MRSLLLATVAVSTLFAAALSRTEAAPLVRLDFTGSIDNIRPQPDNPLSGFINTAPEPMSAVSGFLTYDAGTPATSPGVWALPTATYQATFGGLTISATGLTASLTGANNSAISFRFAIAPSQFPISVTAANGNLDIQTFRDNAFDPFVLPTAVPADFTDEGTGFTYTTTSGVNGLVNTGTILTVTATLIGDPISVPEPVSLLLLGTGLMGLAAASRRRRA